MKKAKQIFSVFLFILIFFILKNISYAGSQSLNSLDYNVTVESNGDMNVVETWDIYISETNTLFKNLKNDNYFSPERITNVEVKDLSNNIDLTKIDTEMYHVTKDCYYALPISDDKFEIAWGVGLDNSSATRKYQISYKIKKVITKYNDCSELYWKFLDTSNGIPADRVTGLIRLPKPVNELSNLRVWAHGPLNGEIRKESSDTVVFSVDDLKSETMLEVRVVTEEDIYEDISKTFDYNQLDNIIAEETKWANKANRQRMKLKIIMWIVNIIYGIIALILLKQFIKHVKELKGLVTNKREKIDIGKYFRDIPREKISTPAEAAFLYYSKGNHFGIGNNMPKVISATILQLCDKGWLSIDVLNKKDINIKILEGKTELAETEKIIYDLLKSVDKDKNNEISMEQLKKYASKAYNKMNNIVIKIENKAKEFHISNKNYDKKVEKIGDDYLVTGYLYLFAGIIFHCFIAALFLIDFISLKMFGIVFFELIICGIIPLICARKVNYLTEQGETERQQWKGLKRYMEDFSMLDKREIPELVLWNKYLVYATAFGISEKVVKQLKVVYPEINELDSSYGYMYWMTNSTLDHNFINSFDNGIGKMYSSYKSAYSEAHSTSSSGSGGGGGFSSGGGGGGRRWPEWAEDKIKMEIRL